MCGRIVGLCFRVGRERMTMVLVLLEGFRGRWNGTQWGGKDGEEEEVLIKDWLI